MEKTLFGIAMWAVCCVFAWMSPASDFTIAFALATLIGVCLQNFLRDARWQFAEGCLLCGLCALLDPMTPFLPVGVYLCVFTYGKAGSVVALICWAVTLMHYSPFSALRIAVLCGAAGVVALSASRSLSSLTSLMEKRDHERETTIKLSARLQDTSQPNASSPAELFAEAIEDPYEGLTQRERSIAELVAEGLDNREISEALFLSEGTVRNNISTILQKKDLKNRTQLAVLCLRR